MMIWWWYDDQYNIEFSEKESSKNVETLVSIAQAIFFNDSYNCAHFFFSSVPFKN